MLGVFTFYCIVIGWVLHYFSISITGKINTIDSLVYFQGFAESSYSLIPMIIAFFVTGVIVSSGVKSGIEKINLVAIPTMLILFLVMLCRSVTLDGAIEGIKYICVPRFDALLNIETWLMAMGQAFFTFSLGGCGMVVYGSCMGMM